MNRDIKEMFPDWNNIKPGMWSLYTKLIGNIEIGLYREPLDADEEIAGTLTFQIFDGDNVIACKTVKNNETEI